MAHSKARWTVWFASLTALGSGCDKHVSAAYPPTATPIQSAPSRYDPCAADPTLCSGPGHAMNVESAVDRRPQISLTGPLAAAPAARAERTGLNRIARTIEKATIETPRTPVAPAPIPTPSVNAQQVWVDLEANLSIEVSDPRSSVQAVRSLIRAAEGELVNESLENNASQIGAALSIRVPSNRANWFIDRVSGLGKVTSLKTQATDVGRKVVDAETVLHNLEAALARYQELLRLAESVKDMTEVQRDMDRVAMALDRVKADLSWMKDRVARSTVYIQFALPHKQRVEQTAKLHLGLRVPYAADLGPARGRDGYFGAGFSLLILRAFNLDLDLFTHADRSRRDGVNLLTATGGSEFYSNLLGGGERRFFNPYLGFRVGYANLGGDGTLALGASVGLELAKVDFFALELETRTLALVGAQDGTHVLMVPAMTARAAY